MKKIITYFSFFSLVCLLSGCQLIDQLKSNMASKGAKEEFIERLAKFTTPNDQGLIGIKAERQYPSGSTNVRTIIIDTEKSIYSDSWEWKFEDGSTAYDNIIEDDRFRYISSEKESQYLRKERSVDAKSIVANYKRNRKDALAYLRRFPEKDFYSKNGSIFMNTIYKVDDHVLYALSDGVAIDFNEFSQENPILPSTEEDVYLSGDSLVFEWKDGGKSVITAFSPTDAPQRPDNYYVESEEE
ncbi:hypothetical protein ABID29_001545 [Streptococcus rupicaprae]|uniref:Lipoprotein n=1 Tax=Streptococcus rupicaprae TaxID=759619 RepID=A0ABV2FIN1_9STRE